MFQKTRKNCTSIKSYNKQAKNSENVWRPVLLGSVELESVPFWACIRTKNITQSLDGYQRHGVLVHCKSSLFLYTACSRSHHKQNRLFTAVQPPISNFPFALRYFIGQNSLRHQKLRRISFLLKCCFRPKALECFFFYADLPQFSHKKFE